MSGRQKLRCTLVKNERLTPTDHWQDVRVFEFRCDPVQYSPGDVLTIFPKNTEQDVEAILSVMDWTAEADKPIHFEPTSPPYDGKWYPPPPLPLKRGATLRDLLRNHLDINSIPRRSFFTQVAHFTQDEMQKERLVDFTMPEYVDELYDYTSRPRRSIIEVLQEFDTVRIPLKWAASVFPLIRGRQFSIASGGELKVNEDGSGRIQLLVAIVKYKTVIKKLREGLCTKYLADLEPGAQMETVLCKGGMRYDPSKPAVMIGPGTGVAPIRSMMHERASLDQPASQNQSLPNILFYGGRNRTADFFFEDEWKRLQSEAALEVHTAFSRDQRSKVYVQDIIRQQANAVFNILRSGYVHICG